MRFYYDGQRICSDDHIVTIAATREEAVVKWLDYVYSLQRLPGQRLRIWWVYYFYTLTYNYDYTLNVTNFNSDEVFRQVRQWSQYDEFSDIEGFTEIKDLPIRYVKNRNKLRKVALLLSLKCDVLSMVARRLITKWKENW